MAKLAKEKKSVKSAAEINANEIIENQAKVEEVEEIVADLSIVQQFGTALDRVQESNIKIEARQTFTKQEVMAIVASILK